jgi:hypothetical protein
MKKVIASLATAAFALVSVQAFAQASDATAPAAASATKHHKKLKTHGKRAKVSAAASAAGTNDKGTQN